MEIKLPFTKRQDLKEAGKAAIRLPFKAYTLGERVLDPI